MSTTDVPWFENAGGAFRLYVGSAKVGVGRTWTRGGEGVGDVNNNT